MFFFYFRRRHERFIIPSIGQERQKLVADICRLLRHRIKITNPHQSTFLHRVVWVDLIFTFFMRPLLYYFQRIVKILNCVRVAKPANVVIYKYFNKLAKVETVINLWANISGHKYRRRHALDFNDFPKFYECILWMNFGSWYVFERD